MDRDMLYKLFSGSTSEAETENVRKWAEESEDNLSQLMAERKLYDAISLSELKAKSNLRKTRFSSVVKYSSYAACLVILLVSSFFIGKNAVKPDISMNTVIVPVGQRVNLVLSDGTNLWLNSGATFKYPSSFTKDSREVYLLGEAYFDVAHDENRAFRVKTDILDVKVTGTEFNLISDTKNDEFEVSLFKGSVEICRNGEDSALAKLNPNQTSTFQNGMHKIGSIVNTDKYAWKEGLYSFHNKMFDKILVDLERYYCVDFIFNKPVLSLSLTGKFRISDGLNYALGILQHSVGFAYTIDDDKRIVYIN
jgi:ferric-dicitrate binding protein FerR (iron transport regulator)